MKRLILTLWVCLFLFSGIYGQEFRFALITDTHLRPNDTLAYNDLKYTVEHINQSKGLAFVLVTGDLTEEGDRSSLLKVKELLDRLNIPYYALSGNHETKWSESGSTDFAHIFGSERFDYNYNEYRFLGFGTGPVIRMMEGHVAPQDISWLKTELAKEPEQQAFLITHYPLTPGDVDNWYEVTDAVRSFPIKTFMGGHYHTNRLLSYDGIPAFLCRSNLRDEDGVGGYSVFTVTSDSILVAEQKWNKPLKPWGGYSLHETYYTADNSGYSRPDYSVNAEYPKVEEEWLVKVEYALYASPWVYDGKVYIGDDAGYILCYRVDNGAFVWRFKTGNRIVGTADAAHGIVVVGSADEYIYGLDAGTGKEIWKYKADGPVLGSAAIAEDVVYIGSSDGCMRALDLKTGKLLWNFKGVKGYIETCPLVYGDKVVFGAWDNNMYALDKHSGKLLWTWDGELTRMHFSPAAVWPVGADGKIFFTAPDRVLTALDTGTGNTVWRTSESMVRETIGLSEDRERIYSKTMQDSVVCYAVAGNVPQRLWSINVGYGYDHAASMPLEKDGVVFGSTKNGIMFGVEGKTGKLLWKHKTGNSLIGTLFPLSSKEAVFTSSEGIIGKLKIRD